MHIDPASYLPLTEPTFYILLSLAPDKKHGYAILRDVEALSKGGITLSTSTLYSALGRLLERGLVERIDDDPGQGPHPGLPRKAYTLSDVGRRILEAEIDRMQTLATIARLHLSEEYETRHPDPGLAVRAHAAPIPARVPPRV